MTTTHDDATAALARFATARQVLLTTYRRDGTPVGTPVHIAVDGARAFVRTFSPSGKITRLRREPRADIAPCTLRGRVRGEPLAVAVRFLPAGEEYDRAGGLIAARHSLAHRRLIPWFHRRTDRTTIHLELTPA
jgi:PPOX class probable F420-dependent enzyme